ncbi:serine/threonine-protein kinase/endoribonuclease IRE2-like, partial [Ctenocephalides felis]
MHLFIYLLFILLTKFSLVLLIENKQTCTDVARDDENLLVLSTLGGKLIALDPLTGSKRWSIDDEPALKVPQPKTGQYVVSQFLPNPKDGSLYTWQDDKEESSGGLLHKMPFTIPQLVANAPCRSSDGIFYSGKKSDSWTLVDIKTGVRKKVIEFDDFPILPSRSHVLLGRSYYTILMYNDMTKGVWNVTYVDYSSHTMSAEMTNEYNFIHLSGSEYGLTATLDRITGSYLWEFDTGSPVVAIYVLNKNGLLAVPFTTVSDDALSDILTNTKLGAEDNMNLFPTLYVGEHVHGIYALPSLIHSETAIIKKYPKAFLIEGPDNKFENNEVMSKNIKHMGSTNLKDYRNFILLGYYYLPQKEVTSLKISANRKITEISSTTQMKNEITTITFSQDNKSLKNSLYTADGSNVSILNSFFKFSNNLLNIMENASFITLFMSLMSMMLPISIIYYKRNKLFVTTSNDAPVVKSDEKRSDIRIGKISFDQNHLLGKGCEGTFVFKGSFESRPVAVKRLLPECFSIAEREVSLLKESDMHPNVVRYFCTEQDLQFMYIALELCCATLQDYVDKSLNFKCKTSELELLLQATSGLEHLHSLNIVHRDIKPHNVLLSLPDQNGFTRAMISDFGLCKKLLVGKLSFSKASGMAGTEGWIAPEIIKEERSTAAVDVFSLGCVFYYVLSHGAHPFGGPLHRQANILSGHYSLALLEDKPVAQNILSSMIDKTWEKRPPISAVRYHPVFWNEAKSLAFLQDISDRIENEVETALPVKNLEIEAHQVIRNDWKKYLDTSISDDLRKYRTYSGSNVRDLLRAIRNKKHHYHQLSPDALKVLGTIPVDFTRYWLERFP